MKKLIRLLIILILLFLILRNETVVYAEYCESNTYTLSSCENYFCDIDNDEYCKYDSTTPLGVDLYRCCWDIKCPSSLYTCPNGTQVPRLERYKCEPQCPATTTSTTTSSTTTTTIAGGGGDCLGEGEVCWLDGQCCSGDCNWFICTTPATTTTTTTSTTTSTTSTITTTTSAGSTTTTTATPSTNSFVVNFGISAENEPWIQSKGSDLRLEGIVSGGGIGSGTGGYNFSIPENPETTLCGPDQTYASIPGTGSHGIIFSGDSDYSFCEGGVCQDRASTNQWVVGGGTYQETYAPVNSGGRLKTSYEYISARIAEAGITPTVITDLSVGLANGVYLVNGGLTTPASGYTFSTGKNYVILVNGDLTIAGNVLVPNGSSVSFIVKGNIIVNNDVGESLQTSSCTIPRTLNAVSTGCNIEGYYSANGIFTMLGTGECATEKRLNLAGSLVVNANLATSNAFDNQRDLCAGNAVCPVFTITERPDFLLNAPDLIKRSNYIWQEVAP